MAGVFQRMAEAVFKPVPGGHIFPAPHPWLFGPRQFYLVNDAQKAEVLECFRRHQRIFIPSIAVGMLLIVAVSLALSYLGWNVVLTFVIIGVVGLVPILVIPHLYLMRMLAPIIKDLPKSDQRITQRELLENVATVTPRWLMIIGLVGGSVMILAAILGLADAFTHPRGGGRWIQPAFSLTFGAILVAYFIYLARLKGKQNRTPPP
jgi:hypothetical protein